MKRLRILNFILKRTRTYPIILSFVAFIFIDALIIQLVEPNINTYGDALWYCYAVLSTAGFGDIVAATFVGKIASVILTVYALFVFAIATGVVVNFHSQLIQLRQKETLAAFIDKMEHLPELSKEELEEMSERVKLFFDEEK